MLSIIFGILLFCLALGLFIGMLESGLLLHLVNCALFFLGLWIIASFPGVLTTILGIALIVLPFWLIDFLYPGN